MVKTSFCVSFSFSVLAADKLPSPYLKMDPNKLQVLTEVWGPYNYMDGDKPVGLSTELVEAALKKAGIEYELWILPWKRAYTYTLDRPNTIIFTITRTPARENIFKWIGPLYYRKPYFYKLKSRTEVKASTFEELKLYRVGVINGGSTQETLISKGFVNGINLSPVSNAHLNLDKLFLGRIDFTIGSAPKFIFQLKDNNKYKFEDMERTNLKLSEGDYYIAANKETPDEIVQKIQTALDQLIKDGLRNELWRKHLGDVPFESATDSMPKK